MAKDNPKAQKALAKKHLQARISYLYKAAAYLSNCHDGKNPGEIGPLPSRPKEIAVQGTLHTSAESTADQLEKREQSGKDPKLSSSRNPSLPRLFVSHLRAVSLKSQIRLAPEMKHSICKRCDILLVPGSTCTRYTENKSRGGRKPWADVLLITCTACGAVKRFPVGSKRQAGRGERQKDEKMAAG